MQTIRVSIKPELIIWARERAGYSVNELSKTFKKLSEWESGQSKPTLNQVRKFAQKVHVPEGYLYCSSPPEEPLPVTDFRTFSGKKMTRPSPNLLSTLYDCESRQDWYRDFAMGEGLLELDFIGSATLDDDPTTIAQQIVSTLGFDLEARQSCSSWLDALRFLVRKVDEAGILVMVSGIVGNNTHRRLDPDEFRGFALSDSFAPLIFVNGADTKAAQIFTLAHELAHLWLGDSALSISGIAIDSRFPPEEVWCNAVAAEMLVPLEHFKLRLQENESLKDSLARLAKLYKVSTLVILRRMLDARHLNHSEYQRAWQAELKLLSEQNRPDSSGGNFYRSTIFRVGRRFAYALISSANVGKTLSRDAFRLLGIKKADTYDQLAREVGVSR